MGEKEHLTKGRQRVQKRNTMIHTREGNYDVVKNRCDIFQKRQLMLAYSIV